MSAKLQVPTSKIQGSSKHKRTKHKTPKNKAIELPQVTTQGGRARYCVPKSSAQHTRQAIACPTPLVCSTERTMLSVVTREYQIANIVEAAVWVAVGILCLLPTLKVRWTRSQRWLAAVTFVLFGISDLAET